MKGIVLIVLAFFLANCSVFSQSSQLVKDANNNVIGYVESGNSFYDLSSYKLFQLNESGQFVNFNADLLSTYNASTGIFVDLNGDFQLKFIDNKVYDEANHIIGIVSENGDVFDNNNHLLGKGDYSNRALLVYYFWVYNKI